MSHKLRCALDDARKGCKLGGKTAPPTSQKSARVTKLSAGQSYPGITSKVSDDESGFPTRYWFAKLKSRDARLRCKALWKREPNKVEAISGGQVALYKFSMKSGKVRVYCTTTQHGGDIEISSSDGPEPVQEVLTWIKRSLKA